MIRRTIKNLDAETFKPLYTSLVRSHLEYGNAIWAPYKIKYIESLEKVQRRATKQVNGLGNLTYEERLRKLNLPSLSYRRLRGDMIEVYKLTHGLYDINPRDIIPLKQPASQLHNLRRHNLQIKHRFSRTNIRKNYLPLRIAHPWNSLPHDIVNAGTLNTFKNKLDKHWKNEDIVFNYKANTRL